MTFLVHAFDFTDAEALNRRLAARETHISGAKSMHEKGELVLAGAMLSPDEKMIGSVVIIEMESLEAVENWLRNEVYVQQNVWDKVNIYPMRIAIR
jgi:uncharacterized protein YciI